MFLISKKKDHKNYLRQSYLNLNFGQLSEKLENHLSLIVQIYQYTLIEHPPIISDYTIRLYYRITILSIVKFKNDKSSNWKTLN